MGVSMSPGQMQLMRMLSRPWSSAMARVNWTTAPLEAQYAAARTPPASPQPDPMLMMLPPPAPVYVNNPHLGALGGKHERDGAADAGAGAGDEGDFAL